MSIKGKDSLQHSSYRPISILNGDDKILSRILATRLEKLPQRTSADQTGYIFNRHCSCNLRRLLNIISGSPASVPEMVISADSEKAFDGDEWNYLFSTIKQFGFSQASISSIKLLYVHPMAAIVIDGQQFDYYIIFI